MTIWTPHGRGVTHVPAMPPPNTCNGHLPYLLLLCLVSRCLASEPRSVFAVRRGAGAPPPPPTGRRWGYFLGALEGEQLPLHLELSPFPPS